LAETGVGDGNRALIDLGSVAAMVRRRSWPMLAAAATVVALMFVLYSMADKRYEASARVAIDRAEEQVVRTSEDRAAPLMTDSASVDTEVEVIQSEPIVLAAVTRLNLRARPDFLSLHAAEGDELSHERTAAIVASGLDVKRVGVSYAIEVTYRSGSPQLAADIVNAVVSAYVNGQVATEVAARGRDIGLLRERMEQLRGDVLAADAALARFKAETNLITIEQDSTVAQQELSVLSNMLAESRAAETEARAQSRAGSASASVANSPVVRDLRARSAVAAARRDELAERYGPNHPSRQGVQAELDSLNQQIATEVARARSTAAADASVAAQRSASIQASLNAARGELLAGNNASVRLNELESQADSARQLYQAFLDRYRAELATQGTERSGARLIAAATTPTRPVSPDPLLYLAAGLVGGLLAAALVAAILEARERGVRNRAEAEAKLALPVITSIPDLRTVKGVSIGGGGSLEIANYLVDDQGSIFAESFRSLRNALKVGQPGQVAKSVAITSSIPGEGKTTTAICLARSAALAGHRTLLIDCDLRRHASSRTLAEGPRLGLIDVLNGSANLEAATIVDSRSGAFLLPQAASDAATYDLVTSHAMSDLLKRLSQQFALIVLDTAPVLSVAESRGLSALVDATLLTVRWRTTPVHQARMAIDQLERAGATISGVLLSQVDMRAKAALGDEMVYYSAYGEPAPA
jgi:capsular exopolysaccharide synthesis family protein